MRPSLIIGLAAAAGLTTLIPTTATASGDDSQTLADVVLSDSAKDGPDGFDRRSGDYDIVTQAVLLYPDLVAAAGDPNADLTVFLPTDQAFRVLVKEVAGSWLRSEADVFAAVASLGTDTVLNVLSYHIVPRSISYRAALKSDGAVLATLLPDTSITVDVNGRWWRYIQLADLDVDDRDPIVIAPNVGGQASNGFAHGIDRVLRPIDLP